MRNRLLWLAVTLLPLVLIVLDVKVHVIARQIDQVVVRRMFQCQKALDAAVIGAGQACATASWYATVVQYGQGGRSIIAGDSVTGNSYVLDSSVRRLSVWIARRYVNSSAAFQDQISAAHHVGAPVTVTVFWPDNRGSLHP